jgi:hypothetical protein
MSRAEVRREVEPVRKHGVAFVLLALFAVWIPVTFYACLLLQHAGLGALPLIYLR